MSRLEQAEALLREYVGEWSRTGGELSPEWRNEWRDCVRTHLAAAPRSITRAEALAVAQPGDVLEGEAGVRRWALFMDTGKWLLDNGTHWLRDLTDQGGYSTPLHSTVRWHTLRTATGTYSITADAQPGDDSAEADGLAVDTFKAAQLGPLRAALAEEQAVVAALRESLTDLHHMTNRGNLAHRKRDSMDYASGVIRQARAAARGEK